MHSLELKIPPVVLWLSFALLMHIATSFWPVLTFDFPARRLVALILVVFGIYVGIAGVIAFRSHRTTVNPTTPEKASTVVTSGIYRFSRNPMYLALLLGLAGWAIWLANFSALGLLPLFVAYMTFFQIIPEERAMRNKFGNSYTRYLQTTRRWCQRNSFIQPSVKGSPNGAAITCVAGQYHSAAMATRAGSNT